MFKKYLSYRKEMMAVEENDKRLFSAIISSFFITIFILSGPFILLYNLIYFYEMLRIVVFGFVMLGAFFLICWRKLYLDSYYRGISGKKINYMILIEGIIILILFTVGYFVSWIWW